jgi:CheY-like chemotaxis protein
MERRPDDPPPRPLVLIADGHDDTLALYAVALSAMGFDVLAAKDSAKAYNRAWTLRPAIIATDLTLRDGSGWELLQQLKEDARTRDIPVVLMMTDGQPALRQRAEREGFAALFPKPCPPDDLAACLRQVLYAKAYAEVRR